MKLLGYLLIALGFFAGSLVAVQTEENTVNWSLYVPAIAVGAVGVGLARAGAHRESRAEANSGDNVGVLVRSLERVVANIVQLDDEKMALDVYDVHGRIDELFIDDLGAFVDARESIVHVFGLQAYADIMNEFAAGERYLNRSWSSSVDGYIDEVHASLTRAREQFIAAQGKLLALVETPRPVAGA